MLPLGCGICRRKKRKKGVVFHIVLIRSKVIFEAGEYLSDASVFEDCLPWWRPCRRIRGDTVVF